jgi:hypothetical protein
MFCGQERVMRGSEACPTGLDRIGTGTITLDERTRLLDVGLVDPEQLGKMSPALRGGDFLHLIPRLGGGHCPLTRLSDCGA